MLVKRDDLGGEVYAGCETSVLRSLSEHSLNWKDRYRRKALVKRKGSDKVEETYMYGIASVVTPVKHHRELLDYDVRSSSKLLTGHGYATHMLRLLHYHIGDPSTLPPFPSAWGAPPRALRDPSAVPPSIASILWSDVGSEFYSKCTIGSDLPGWTMDFCNTELTWSILPDSKPLPDDPKWEWIYPNQLPSVGEEMSALARKKMQDIDTSQRTIFQNDPASPGLLSFIYTRGSWRTPEIKLSDPCGVRLRHEGVKDDTIVIFAPKNPSLGDRVLISCIHNLDPSDLPALLRVLDPIGARVGHPVGWTIGMQPDDPVVKAWQGLKDRKVSFGQRGEGIDHLLGTAYYGSADEKRELLDCQMWGWC